MVRQGNACEAVLQDPKVKCWGMTEQKCYDQNGKYLGGVESLELLELFLTWNTAETSFIVFFFLSNAFSLLGSEMTLLIRKSDGIMPFNFPTGFPFIAHGQWLTSS